MKNLFQLRALGIDTYDEYVIYLRSDCHICKSEGFQALTRLQVHYGNKQVVATLNVIKSDLLLPGEASLSEKLWADLDAKTGEEVMVSHLSPINSLSLVRTKIYGNTLNDQGYLEIIRDIVEGKYSAVHIAGFVTSCVGNRLTDTEVIGLTRAMLETGEKIHWDRTVVADKHCTGGIPANRTTPIVVAVVAACGLTIPKTSSRAITSPAGTADTMSVITNVNLDIAQIRKVVEKENACLVWGGAARLSPADDLLIKVERSLDIDSEGQMIASVLSKKVAAGSTHVLIDIPCGETAKVRSMEEANRLKHLFETVGIAMGIQTRILVTDGSQPVGRGIGPVLEAIDVLSVLRNEAGAPQDLKEKSILLSGELLAMAGGYELSDAMKMAWQALESGRAYQKLEAICRAQGKFAEPELAKYHHTILAMHGGRIAHIHNRKLSKVAKLAGAPDDLKAGVLLHQPLDISVSPGQPLYTIYANSRGQLNYAMEYVQLQNNIITIEP